MYLRYYGLRDKPFQPTHDPAFYYSAAHQIPLNELCYSIEERQGLALLLGAPGTGKTTLLRRLLASFGPRQRGVFVSDAALESGSLVRKVAISLGAADRAARSDPGERLFRLLTSEAQRGHTIVVLVDEAQGLTWLQLEEVRYLTNVEVDGQKPLEIILAGQQALETRLASPGAAALRQRVAVRCRLAPLDVEQTAAYVEHRLLAAGATDSGLFTRQALELVQESTGGIPRLINMVCERSLLIGYADGSKLIDRRVVHEALADLRGDGGWGPDGGEAERTASLEPSLGLEARLEAIEQKLDLLLAALPDGRPQRSIPIRGSRRGDESLSPADAGRLPPGKAWR